MLNAISRILILRLIDQMKAKIRLLQEEPKSLKTVMIEDLQTKVDHIDTNVANTNKRIEKFKDKFGKRFEKLEHLLLNRLPEHKTQVDTCSQDSVSSTSSVISNLTSISSFKIQTRIDYL